MQIIGNIDLIFSLLFFAGLCSAAAEDAFREFLDTQGNSISAKLINVRGDDVVIQRADGHEFRCPISLFSIKDQKYIRNWGWDTGIGWFLPVFFAGLVGLRGAGWRHSGLYYVQKVTHKIRKGAWTQDFTLKREGYGATVPVVPT